MQECFTEANEAGVPEKLRRYIRILIDLGRLAGEKADLYRFLDRAVVRREGIALHPMRLGRYFRLFASSGETSPNERVIHSLKRDSPRAMISSPAFKVLLASQAAQ